MSLFKEAVALAFVLEPHVVVFLLEAGDDSPRFPDVLIDSVGDRLKLGPEPGRIRDSCEDASRAKSSCSRVICER
ncbi:hypothetical protein [Leifsonia sp. NPDC077715]|uniref:hypothetical protein n=1 Tax=Leifsonia sp. NPDC077715 TaxID=3155539 RepID=UPI00341EF477